MEGQTDRCEILNSYLFRLAYLSCTECHRTLFTFKILDLFMHICDVSFQQTWLQKNFVTKVTFDIPMTFMNSHNVSFKVHWQGKTLVTVVTLVIFWPGMNRLEKTKSKNFMLNIREIFL